MKYIRTKDNKVFNLKDYDEIDINVRNDILLVNYSRDEYLMISEDIIDEIH